MATKSRRKIADSIRRGLEEAVAYAKGAADKKVYRVHVPDMVDVRPIRTKADYRAAPSACGTRTRARPRATASTC